jgi:hypothetical protein
MLSVAKMTFTMSDYAKCRYLDCRKKAFMLSGVMLNALS